MLVLKSLSRVWLQPTLILSELSSVDFIASGFFFFCRNQNEIAEFKYAKLLKETPRGKIAYPVGTLVRLRLKRFGVFDKSYLQNFSDEIYRVRMVVKAPPTYLYHLETLRGQPIEGR
jgi:hypothetical protein